MEDRRTGQQLGNYRLTRLIGQGGFGDVYLGEHVYLETQAAIKVLHRQLTSDELEGFLNEARTIGHLEHPNIVRVLDFGVEDGTPFLAMTYAPNGTLAQRHPRGTRLPLATIASYIKQVASALQFAHDQRIIHRDVKPYNMFLGRNNEVLLGDFGIATPVHHTITQLSQDFVGTPLYMAPEQIQGKPRPASDQYALGVTVYEWLCGDTPFHGGSAIEVGFQHLSVSPPFLHEKVPEISPLVEEVVLKALAKDPRNRFPSVQEFANAFEQATLGQPFDEPIQPLATIAAAQEELPVLRELEHAMEDNLVLAGEGKRLAPIVYDIYISIPDHRQFNQIFDVLRNDWQKHLIDFAKQPQRHYILKAAPTLHLYADSQLRRGEIRVETSLGTDSTAEDGSIMPTQAISAEQLAQLRAQLLPDLPKWRPPEQPIRTWTPGQPEDVIPGPPTVMAASVALSSGELKDFFISYNSTNFSWAAWIAQQLEEAGYSTLLPPWGLRLDSDFELEMRKAVAKAKRMVAVLSPAYMNILNTQSTWIETFKRNTTIEPNTLIAIHAQECGDKFRKLLESINHIDVIGKDEATAQAMLLAGIHGQGVKLTVKVFFPGSTVHQPLGKEAGSSDQSATTPRQPTEKEADKIATEPGTLTANSVYTGATLIQQIEIAFTKKDWPVVIRKVDLLKKLNPLTIPPAVYHMQGLAFQAEHDLQNAYKALHDALSLVSEDDERLLLLDDCATMLIELEQWSEVLKLTREALRLSPNNPTWSEREKQALAQLQGTKKQAEPQPGPITTSATAKGISIFFSYSHEDEALRDKLDMWLRPLQHEGLITSWHDGKIEPGKEWPKEIEERLGTASIILLLVTANFMASDYCYSVEVKQAVARHQAGKARVIPVILRPADWHNAPFGILQALPKGSKPVTTWPDKEKAFLDVVKGIRKAVEELTNTQKDSTEK